MAKRDLGAIAELLGQFPGKQSRIADFPEIAGLPEEQQGRQFGQQSNVGELLRLLSQQGGVAAPQENFNVGRLQSVASRFAEPENEDKLASALLQVKAAQAARQPQEEEEDEEGQSIESLLARFKERTREDLGKGFGVLGEIGGRLGRGDSLIN